MSFESFIRLAEQNQARNDKQVEKLSNDLKRKRDLLRQEFLASRNISQNKKNANQCPTACSRNELPSKEGYNSVSYTPTTPIQSISKEIHNPSAKTSAIPNKFVSKETKSQIIPDPPTVLPKMKRPLSSLMDVLQAMNSEISKSSSETGSNRCPKIPRISTIKDSSPHVKNLDCRESRDIACSKIKGHEVIKENKSICIVGPPSSSSTEKSCLKTESADNLKKYNEHKNENSPYPQVAKTKTSISLVLPGAQNSRITPSVPSDSRGISFSKTHSRLSNDESCSADSRLKDEATTETRTFSELSLKRKFQPPAIKFPPSSDPPKRGKTPRCSGIAAQFGAVRTMTNLPASNNENISQKTSSIVAKSSINSPCPLTENGKSCLLPPKNPLFSPLHIEKSRGNLVGIAAQLSRSSKNVPNNEGRQRPNMHSPHDGISARIDSGIAGKLSRSSLIPFSSTVSASTTVPREKKSAQSSGIAAQLARSSSNPPSGSGTLSYSPHNSIKKSSKLSGLKASNSCSSSLKNENCRRGSLSEVTNSEKQKSSTSLVNQPRTKSIDLVNSRQNLAPSKEITRPQSAPLRGIAAQFGALPISSRPVKRATNQYSDEETDDDYASDDSFIDDSESMTAKDYQNYVEDIHKTLNFDPKKYISVNRFDDLSSMESNFRQIEKEEKISARLGMKEDEEDIAAETARRQRRLKK